MSQKKTVGVDLDDVLLDFNTAFCAYHNTHYGTTITRSMIVLYNLENTFGVTTRDIHNRIIDFYNDEDHSKALPVSGAQEAIQRLALEYRLEIVTGKPEYLRTQTEMWLTKHFGDVFTGLHFTDQFVNPESRKRKSDICMTLGVKTFIDDGPYFVREIADKGVPVLLFDAPWNSEVQHPQITRVKNWSEIVTHLLY